MIDYIKTSMGDSIIPLELKPEHYVRCEENTLREYNRIAPRVLDGQFITGSKQSVYTFTDAEVGRGIIYVAEPPGILRPIPDTSIVPNVLSTEYSPIHNFGDYDMFRTHYQQMRKEFSADFQWDYNTVSKELHLYPPPRGGQVIYYKYLQPSTLGTLHTSDEYWALEYGLNEARHILGQVRQLLANLQGQQNSFALNGNELLSEYRERRQELIENLYSRYQVKYLLPMKDS